MKTEREALSKGLARSTGKGIRVAVLDTGLDVSSDRAISVLGRDRELLLHSVEDVGYVLRPDSLFASVTRDVMTDNNLGHLHGTLVAHIIATLAPDARIVCIQLPTNTRLSDCAKAIEYAVTIGVRLINLSFSGGEGRCETALYRACLDAYSKGVAIIAAKANFGHQGCQPANYPHTHGTGCSGTDAHSCNMMAEPFVATCGLEHYLDNIEFGAWDSPLVPCPGTEQVRGTSYATPRVTAICARLLEMNPHLAPYELKAALASLATRVQRQPHRSK